MYWAGDHYVEIACDQKASAQVIALDTFKISNLKKIDKKRRTLVSVSRLSESIDEMDEIGVVPNYVVRMKAEQENLFKNVWRSFQIKETTFIPAAYSVVEIVSGFLIVCLMFMNLDPFIESLAILSMLMYLFIYLVFFIKDMGGL